MSSKREGAIVQERDAEVSHMTNDTTPLSEGREGMVTVWDKEGRYLGCMGVPTWGWLLRQPAEAHVPVVSGEEPIEDEFPWEPREADAL